MHDPLAPLLADGVIDEVVARLKSGKEADLWLVRHGGDTVAAKVYKAREARSFRRNAGYKEGRQVRDTRTQRAMDRGSRFGQAAAEEAWKAKEADALHLLHAAGVRVPRPVLFYEGVLLMELVLDAHGRPAPRLVDAHVSREHAAPLYADLRAQAVRMLGCDLIHGDLSPYNVLLGHGGPVVIDFPQVVGAAHNSQAESYFVRDLENLRRFFAAIDPALRSAANDAREIWRAYARRELSPDFVPTGRPSEPPPRRAPHGPAKHHRPEHRPPHAAPHGREPERGREAAAPPAGSRDARAPGRAEPHERHRSSAPKPRGPGRSGPERRRVEAGPEVIRVVRPQAAGGPAPAGAHRATPGGSDAHASHGAVGAGAPRRRRRRRRR